MTGKELFDKYTAFDPPYDYPEGVYAQTLMTIFVNIADQIYPLLERAEKEDKKLDITPEPDYLRDELTMEDIIFVAADYYDKKYADASKA